MKRFFGLPLVVGIVFLLLIAFFTYSKGGSSLVFGEPVASAETENLLTQNNFYEDDDTLKITDTSLEKQGDVFVMNKARYQSSLPEKLGPASVLKTQYENLDFGFSPKGFQWSGGIGKKEVDPVSGRLISNGKEVDGKDNPTMAGKGMVYKNAYGSGIHLGVLLENLVFRKVVRIDRKESLGSIPENAQNLEFPFELMIDDDATIRARFGGEKIRAWDRKETVLIQEESLEINLNGNQIFIQPSKVWDSSGKQISIPLQLSREGDQSILTKLIPVSFLESAIFPVYTDADISFGTAVIYEATSPTTSAHAIAKISSTQVVMAYRYSNQNGKAVVGTISGNSISFGTIVSFDATNYTFDLDIAALDSSTVIISYADGGGGTGTKAIIGTVSGTSISFGSSYQLYSGRALYTRVSALDSSHAVIAYMDVPSSNYGKAVVATITGTNITYGPIATFSSGTTEGIAMTAIDSSKVVLAYRLGPSNNNTSIVGTVSGADITFGSATTIVSGSAGPFSAITKLDSTHVALFYNNNNTYFTNIGTISGTSISFGSSVSVIATNAVFRPGIAALSSSTVVIKYANASSSGTAVIGTISGSTITLGDSVIFNAEAPTWFGSSTNTVAALSSTEMVLVYNNGTAIVGTYTSPAPPAPPAPGLLNATNVEPVSKEKAKVGNVVISFTTISAVPDNGIIEVIFPSGFELSSGAGSTVVSSTGISGVFTQVSPSATTLSLTGTGSGSGSGISSAAAASFTISNIKNPNTDTPGTYSIKTKTSTGTIIDQKTDVTGDTFTDPPAPAPVPQQVQPTTPAPTSSAPRPETEQTTAAPSTSQQTSVPVSSQNPQTFPAPLVSPPISQATELKTTPILEPIIDTKKFLGMSTKDLKIADRNLKSELKELTREYKIALLGEDDKDIIKQINALFKVEKKRIQAEQKLVKVELLKSKAREAVAKKTATKAAAAARKKK